MCQPGAPSDNDRVYLRDKGGLRKFVVGLIEVVGCGTAQVSVPRSSTTIIPLNLLGILTEDRTADLVLVGRLADRGRLDTPVPVKMDMH